MIVNLLKDHIPRVENPGLVSTDPRFDEIVTLVQEEKYTEAKALIEVIIMDGIYDIRLICYYLFSYWLDNGFVSLLDVMGCLNNIISENLEAIGPISNRELSFNKSLDWIFRKIVKKIQYEEKKNSSLWQQWHTNINEDDINKIRESGDVFSSNLRDQFGDGAEDLIKLWSKIDEWLKTLKQLVDHVSVNEHIDSGSLDDKSLTQALEVNDTVLVNNPPPALKSNGLGIECSYHMNLLIKKLTAFENLINERELSKATLIWNDINQTLLAFDPKLYLPNVFETFVRLQAMNIDELSVHMEQRDSIEWHMMEEWFKVDFDAFIKS
jgi:hypothetical protein